MSSSALSNNISGVRLLNLINSTSQMNAPPPILLPLPTTTTTTSSKKVRSKPPRRQRPKPAVFVKIPSPATSSGGTLPPPPISTAKNRERANKQRIASKKKQPRRSGGKKSGTKKTQQVADPYTLTSNSSDLDDDDDDDEDEDDDGSAQPRNPHSVARRNERERNRVKQVNLGFQVLKRHVPKLCKGKKMSKVETLRCAVRYIRELRDMLDRHCDDGGGDSEERQRGTEMTTTTINDINEPVVAVFRHGDAQTTPTFEQQPTRTLVDLWSGCSQAHHHVTAHDGRRSAYTTKCDSASPASLRRHVSITSPTMQRLVGPGHHETHCKTPPTLFPCGDAPNNNDLFDIYSDRDNHVTIHTQYASYDCNNISSAVAGNNTKHTRGWLFPSDNNGAGLVLHHHHHDANVNDDARRRTPLCSLPAFDTLAFATASTLAFDSSGSGMQNSPLSRHQQHHNGMQQHVGVQPFNNKHY